MHPRLLLTRMAKLVPHWQSYAWLLFVTVGSLGCSDTDSPQGTPARPVSFVVLQETNPARYTRLTGSVESWKKEMLSCRVAGRVQNVVEPGVDIVGQVYGEQGGVQEQGTLLADLATDRYELIRDEAAAGVEVAKANAEQVRTELERAIPEQIKAASADLQRETREYQRLKELVERNAVARSDFEESENAYKQADAALAQAQAAQATKTAELAGLVAEISESEQQLRQAEADLADCQLYSPFAGQVSKVHAIAGSYLQAGMPVVTVQMMDPVKIELAVSQQTDRQLRYNDQVSVYVDELGEAVNGFVYLKDTVADAATRTFNVTILVRNRKVESGNLEESALELPRTSDLYNLESENADGQPPFFAEQRSIHKDAQGQEFLWKVEGLTVNDLRGDFDPVFTVRKVPVKSADRSLQILQLYRGRELIDIGDLDPAQDLVTGVLPAGVREGDQVVLSRQEWLLRPGQLVSVDLGGKPLDRGFYVPRPAILRSDGKHFVFVARASDGNQEVAQRVEVQVGELISEFRRVEPIEGQRLEAGEKLILDGAHYLQDGDQVNAFEEIEVAL